MKRLLRVGILAALAFMVTGGCTSDLQPPEIAPSSQAFIPPPPLAFGPMATQSPGEFNGKYVAINYGLGDETAAAILHSPTVKKLGMRDFLVGNVVFADGRASSEKTSASAWVPVDSVDSLICVAAWKRLTTRPTTSATRRSGAASSRPTYMAWCASVMTDS